MSEELKQKLRELAARWERYESPSIAFSEHEAGFHTGYDAAKHTCGEELRELLETCK